MEPLLILWFVMVGLSLLFVIYDSITNTPVSWVQSLAWVMVTLYTGPVGLVAYLLVCRNPGEGMHDAFTKAHWKQALNSEMHCVAGDATGIILAAVLLFSFGIPSGIELVLEYITGFVCGLFIFQAMMMRSMYASYGEAVKRTIFAETVSMNMVMSGMIPVMVTLMYIWPHGRDPAEPLFWFIMGLATIAGGIVAFPINSWLVRRGLKHGCMTIPSKKEMAMPMESMKHEMPKLPKERAIGWVLSTYALLFLVTYVTSLFVPLL